MTARNLVTRILVQLKNNKNLPFIIPKNTCPSKNQYCKQHHGEIVVRRYVKSKGLWHLEYYSTHEKGIIFERDHGIEILRKHLTESFKKGLLKRENIAKLLPYLNKIIPIRFSEQEINMLMKKANKDELTFSDYVRKALKLDLIRDQKS